MTTKETYHKRFMSRFKIAQNGCWEWQLSLNGQGYAQFYAGKVVRGNRYIYEHYKGKIPKGLVVDHLCNNRKCVNPEHLEVKTHRENILRGTGIAAINSKKTHCWRCVNI